jgi:hypothetical protein
MDECSMVCEKTGEVLAREPFRENLLITAKEQGLPVISKHSFAIHESTVLVDCGCGGNMYKCGVQA